MNEPKYKEGERVTVRIVRDSDTFEWTGVVTRTGDTGSDDDPAWEYWVAGAPSALPGLTGFPLLAWESEVSPADPTKNYFAADGTLCNADGSRSIFDDVDQ